MLERGIRYYTYPFEKYEYSNSIWEMLSNKMKIKWGKMNTIEKCLNYQSSTKQVKYFENY